VKLDKNASQENDYLTKRLGIAIKDAKSGSDKEIFWVMSDLVEV
jgi:hypothetical protein